MSRLDRVNDWIELGQEARYDATELARLCAVSCSQLRRYFASEFGEAPQTLLNEIRLWHTGHLLSSSILSVKDISRELNFANESHFCHKFKSYFGCRPSEFALHYRQPQGVKASSLTAFARSIVCPEPTHVPPWKLLTFRLREKTEDLTTVAQGQTSSPRLENSRESMIRRIPGGTR
jgi:AraC-like DNA-binding protein